MSAPDDIAMRRWLAQPRDYASLEVNRRLIAETDAAPRDHASLDRNRQRIAETCAPFVDPPRRPQMPHSVARDEFYGR